MVGLFAAALLATCGAFASSAEHGVHDICLIYRPRGGLTGEGLVPLVAHIGRDGRPRRYLFDGFLFLPPRTEGLVRGPSDWGKWMDWLEWVFGEGGGLDCLAAALKATSAQIGPPQTPRRIFVSLPVPEASADFCRLGLEGVPAAINGAREARQALEAFVERAEARWLKWRAAHKAALVELAGYYWWDEAVRPGEERIVQAAAEAVHRRGRRLLWIPWFRAPGFDRWRELGFDLAIMQPNYAFWEHPWPQHQPPEDRFAEAAELAERHGLGIEIETPYFVADWPEARLGFLLYLQNAARFGYSRAVRAHYQGFSYYAELARSQNPHARRAYDALAELILRGKAPQVPDLLAGARVIVGLRERPELNDGRWGPEGGGAAEVELPAEISLSLPGSRLLSEVRVHFASGKSGLDGVTVVADGRCLAASPYDFMQVAGDEGWVVVPFQPVRARAIALRLEGSGRARIDEVAAYPAGQPWWQARVDGPKGAWRLTEAAPGAGAAGLCLSDSTRLVIWPCHPTAPICGVVLRAEPAAGRAEVKVQVRVGQRQAAATRKLEALGEIAVPLPLCWGRAEVAVRADGPVRLRSVEAIPARNALAGMPYTCNQHPPFQYGDLPMLTDGRLTKQGFPDDVVGWRYLYGRVVLLVQLPGEVRPELVRLHLQGGGHGAVFFPERVVVSASRGGRFARVAASGGRPQRVKWLEAPDAPNGIGWLEVPLPHPLARWLRLDFFGRGWLMISELEILAAGRNIAPRCRIYARPWPMINVKRQPGRSYPDRGFLLTDGLAAPRFFFLQRAAAWNEGEAVELAFPLPGGRKIAAVRVQAARCHRAAIFLPQPATASLLVGGRWTRPIPLVPEGPAVRRSGIDWVWLAARLTQPAAAEAVRIVLHRQRSWLAVSEVEALEGAGP